MGDGQPPPPPDPVTVLSGKCAVTCLTFLDNDTFVSGHQDGQIQVWRLSTQRVLTSWAGHSDSVLWLDLIHNRLLSQGRDGLVKAWTKADTADDATPRFLNAQIASAPLTFCNSAILTTLTGYSLLITPADETSCVNVHAIQSESASESDESFITPDAGDSSSFSISETPLCTLKPPAVKVKEYGMCMKMCSVDVNATKAASPVADGLVLIGYESGSIALWNATKGEMLNSVKLHEDSVMCLTTTTTTTTTTRSNRAAEGIIVYGLSASVSNIVQRWKISLDDGCHTIAREDNVSVLNEGFNSVTVRTDGRIFATGGWDGRGRVFGVKKLRPLAVLTYHKESINCVTFSPDNELVLASKDGYITFWDVYKNR